MHLSLAPGTWRHLSKQMHKGGGGGQKIGENVLQLKRLLSILPPRENVPTSWASK